MTNNFVFLPYVIAVLFLYLFFINFINWEYYRNGGYTYIYEINNKNVKTFYLIYLDKVLKYDLDYNILDLQDLNYDIVSDYKFSLFEKDFLFFEKFGLNKDNVSPIDYFERFGAFYDINSTVTEEGKKWNELELIDKQKLYNEWIDRLYDRFITLLDLKVEDLIKQDHGTVVVFVFYDFYTYHDKNILSSILNKVFNYYYRISKTTVSTGKINRVDILNTKEINVYMPNLKVKIDIEQSLDLQTQRLKIIFDNYDISQISYVDVTSSKMSILK